MNERDSKVGGEGAGAEGIQAKWLTAGVFAHFPFALYSGEDTVIICEIGLILYFFFLFSLI